MKINKQLFVLTFFGAVVFLHPIFGMEEKQQNTDKEELARKKDFSEKKKQKTFGYHRNT